MPSIPQSLLWISLVVLWLFVLVPMLINKRDTVKRTSDVALSTRVLNGRVRSRLLRRSAPAAGHRHDPDWRGEPDLEDDFADLDAEDYDDAVTAAMREACAAGSAAASTQMLVVASNREADTGPVYIDVDVVEENSGALPVGGVMQDATAHHEAAPETGVQETLFEETAEPIAGIEADETTADNGTADGRDHEYEYVEDTSGLEEGGLEEGGLEEGEASEEDPAMVPRSSRRRRMESSKAAAVTARKYRFRKRVLMAMSVIMVLTAALSFTVGPQFWWACASTAVVTILYLGYLRRQTRIEEQVRRRRQQRMARMRYSNSYADAYGEPASRHPEDRGADMMGSRLQRPGAVVLDIDDEDPVFEHLDEVPYSRRRFALPRAAGQ